MSRLLVIHVQIIGSSRFSYIIGTGLVIKQKMKFNKEILCINHKLSDYPIIKSESITINVLLVDSRILLVSTLLQESPGLS